MTEAKQLPQKFAVIVYPTSMLTPYVIRAALNGELDLPEEWHFEDVTVEVQSSIFNPEEKACRIMANVVVGASTDARADLEDLTEQNE